ncbi:ROK family protein [Salipaludibacillus sp. HK11]|uniref:ROK family protein n=1 Tax=Salipaludibacillus sp. HK11 TaxID=3394320 RepID=UPI0039FBE804
MKLAHYLSFDIGGTHTKWGILNNNGDIIKNDFFTSANADGKTILKGIRKKMAEFKPNIEGVAISAPGFIHQETGYIENGGAIRAFDQLQMQKLLEVEFSIPVSIENDVNCVALAEKWLGNGKDSSDFICLTVGTGIGGALILNNQLYRGHSFRGGEFGYMVTSGLHANLPSGDSLSSLASMSSIRKKYAAFYSLPLNEVTGERVFQAYDAHDPAAIQIINSFYQKLAIGIYNITSVLNPEKVLIGGGVTSRPTFVDELRNHLIYIDQVFHVKIEPCKFRNDSGLVGALAFHKLKYNLEQAEIL